MTEGWVKGMVWNKTSCQESVMRGWEGCSKALCQPRKNANVVITLHEWNISLV